MIEKKAWGSTIDVLSRVLDARSLRHSLLTTNIAHADTPQYRPSELKFAEVLNQIRAEQGGSPLLRTDPQHLPASGSREGKEAWASAIESPALPAGNDGNGVEMEKEMAKLAENTLMYNASVQILSKLFSQVRYAIDEGGK
ncbi:MAG: flagellar basal body rod protein FlgB [Candidatus Tectomicrobia bacterium]|uniref:Flagellar basal body rod protein FlgB n=1 Tax=Tectimicrobiota bacterium TaxID=2528274 RepID=A0A932CQI8_UNCTE|nr:flagellar basal body rod protein FlgB [Candidatus Tectomicrobia bacterium]